jgi:hypothetical protein
MFSVTNRRLDECSRWFSIIAQQEKVSPADSGA